MTESNLLAYIIHLRIGTMIISKVQYSDWSKIQDDYEDYMTSLGPYDVDELLSYFENEYKDESSWVFRKNQIQSFMKSNEHILKEDGFDLIDLRGKSPTTLQFNEYINDRNLKRLSSLMTEDHTFIDSSNEVHEGKEMMIKGWQDFFNSYPDYRNIFQIVYVRNDLVIMLGYSVCSHDPLEGPAIWSAKLRDGRLSEWRVYLDNPENRANLGIE